jgi:hypothetical protein
MTVPLSRTVEGARTLAFSPRLGMAPALDTCLDAFRSDSLALRMLEPSIADLHPPDATAVRECVGRSGERPSGHGEAQVEAARITRVDVDATLRADATIGGQTPGAGSFFRPRFLTPAGKGDRAGAVSPLAP